jgi:hypothetical protein
VEAWARPRAFRDAARSESSAWHGDTSKVVFAIHDLHKDNRSGGCCARKRYEPAELVSS